MNIEVNVTDTLRLSDVVDETYAGERVTLADKVAEKLIEKAAGDDGWNELNRRIKEIRDEEIRAVVVPLIAEAFKAPIQRTNAYGDPSGDPITLRDLVLAEAKKVLTSASSTGYRDEPLARRLVREMVEKELTAQLSAAIKEERAKVVAAVRAKAADLIAKAVAEGVTGR